MGRLQVARRGPGRPRTRPGQVLADKAYSSTSIRSHLRRRKIKALIPEPADQARNQLRRGSRGGRPPAFDRATYKQRNTVETSKPHCCHMHGSLALPSVPSGSVFVKAA